MHQLHPELIGRLGKERCKQLLREAEAHRTVVETPDHMRWSRRITGRVFNPMRGFIVAKKIFAR